MKLTFIGTGSAFTIGDGNYQSNMLLESNSQRKLLLDCGSDVRLALYEQGLSHQTIDDVYISHLHSDHIGGLEWLAFSTKFDFCLNKPHLYLSQELVEDLWNRALSAGLNPLHDSSINLSTYFEVEAINNGVFEWEGLTFHIFPTLHIVYQSGNMPSYGLWFEINQQKILITTDTQFDPDGLKELYIQCDIIFQDCETSALKSGVHAHYKELKALHPDVKRKMWLYHYQPGPLPNAQEDGFRGFVKKGQSFDFN